MDLYSAIQISVSLIRYCEGLILLSLSVGYQNQRMAGYGRELPVTKASCQRQLSRVLISEAAVPNQEERR
jgi:hypothetical protein